MDTLIYISDQIYFTLCASFEAHAADLNCLRLVFIDQTLQMIGSTGRWWSNTFVQYCVGRVNEPYLSLMSF